MADRLQDFFGARVAASIAAELARAHPDLDVPRFVSDGLRGLDALGLTARGGHLAAVMRRHLPEDFDAAAGILLASLGPEHPRTDRFGMEPFRYLPHTIFVARHGLEHFETSMRLLHALTRRFTAEGAIRPFLVRYPRETLARLLEWTADPSPHVRRLVSEGTRPRLPWAPRLRAFQEEPAPVLQLLELLKDDPERYVQRSVANNLNDIAKDHPARVVAVCERWSAGAPEGRRWIVRHALRSLVKRGDRGALGTLGAAAAPQLELEAIRLEPGRPRLGETLRVAFELVSTARTAQRLVVDYAVHYVKARGERRPKVFKLRQLTLAPGARVALAVQVSFADLSTRKHHPGLHALEARINGRTFPLGEVEVRR